MIAAGAMHTLRVHHIEPASRSNGPGSRVTLWFQGCSRRCPGCFNPQTHPFEGGRLFEVAELSDHVASLLSPTGNLSISGGEPLEQAESLVAFLQALKQRKDFSCVLFTGFDWDQLQSHPRWQEIRPFVDLLSAGPFRAELQSGHMLVGSTNQTLHFLSSRYTLNDIACLPEAEIVISPDGSLHVSGIFPPSLKGFEHG